MFSFLSRKRATTARINARPVTVAPDETLLQAALRDGIDFPYSCRVGGCATCKCRLVQGRVKSLTEAGYILSDEELDQGYILACQSVPQTDVCIEVDLSRQPARRSAQGRIIGQERLTHDITCLRVQLEETLRYKAGQFAEISLASLPGIVRSYSFATPVRPDAQVMFYVRKVPGGAFSSMVNDNNLVGQRITVDGPLGDFWLRPAQAPLLLVAGGSGLAPILAMLQQAADENVGRPVTLLFGAREEKDLYRLAEIHALSQRWRASFRFIPVLSSAGPGSAWNGPRGMVTTQIETALVPGSHAYLCGPPAMIDASVARLRQLGIATEHIHADRFTTLHDAVAA